MIIIKMNGGLGNQLFQYALAKNLSKKNNNTSIIIDTREYNCNIRKFKLSAFKISGEIYSKKLPSNVFFPDMYKDDIVNKVFRKVHKLLEKNKPLHKKRIIVETCFNFLPDILRIKNNKSIYLVGNWQSEKYFIEISDILKREFTLKNEISENTNIFLGKIKKSDSVALHVRRGDYIISEKNMNFYGTCPLTYYEQAIKIIEEKISNPEFFIFSDDIEWVKANLKIKYPVTYVSGNNIPDYEELILMSHCKHNIIANSTFSWWGAWLNSNPNKIVIAPEKWFNSDTDTRDLIPEGWIKI